MVESIDHRGPDEHGAFRDPWAALGSARLSIVDVAGGQQPLSNEDDSVWVVFNGEIFNHVELRTELEALGHHFRTKSDTEVIVHGWETWGRQGFIRYNGQFSVALWDARSRTLVLARDRFGITPLYLCEHGGRLWFASEVKALFAGDPTIPRTLDPAGLAETFTFWAPVPPQTSFLGVTQLEPGHVRTIHEGHSMDYAFWEPTYVSAVAPRSTAYEADVTNEVEELLEEAVRLRMVRADVPVAAYLSGGVDSSLVAALARPHADRRLKTFSLRFEDPEYDEGRYQQLMVQALGSDHHEIFVKNDDIAAVFPEVIEHAEQPVLRAAPAPMFILSRLVHEEGIKVVLTGEGADEVFGGYDLFRLARVRRFWGRRPDSSMRPLLLERLYPYLERSPVARRELARAYFGRDRGRWREPGFGHFVRWRAAEAVQRLFRTEVREAAERSRVVERLLDSVPAAFARWPYLAQDQYLETRTLLGGYLLSAQGDRMLMAHSVEGRFPYLDASVVQSVNALPPQLKLQGLKEKVILKRVARDRVPAGILRRPKQPYRAPDAEVFLGKDAPGWINDLVTRSSVEAAGVFEPDAVSKLWQKCRTQPTDRGFSNMDNMALLGVLSTGLLHERLIRRSRRSTSTFCASTIVDLAVGASEKGHTALSSPR